ncbi:dockerin type I domain-containing protein [Novipirellula herctigrandis]|uniref:galactose-binding domain-containing protein n=1 Tax=Novipirellula herctigrandis TaxID=2527986 RepID=UPI003AF3A592
MKIRRSGAESRRSFNSRHRRRLLVEPLEERRLLAVYFVDNTGGSDTNNGLSLGASFGTIQRAANQAQPGDTVQIRGGTYRETVTLPRSGSSAAPIVFKPYNNEDVVISGGELVTGWTQYSGDIWQANVNWDAGGNADGNTLFVGGVMQQEGREYSSFASRTSNEGDLLDINEWGQIPQGAVTPTSFTSNDAKGWGDDYWNGARVRFHTKDWIIEDELITDYASSSGKISYADVGTISQKQVQGFFIYDTLKTVDQEGEWFKDGDTLYYQAASGQDPNSLDIEFKLRGYGFDADSRDHIHIEGITFRGVSIDTDSNTDSNIYQGNTFYAYDRANVGRFYITGDDNIFRDNEVSHTWISGITINGERNSLINNYIHDIGYNGTARTIVMSGAEHLFSHNTVSKFARSVFDGYPSRSEIAYNVFEDGGRLSYDTGVFDSDGGNGNNSFSIFHHNVFRNTDSRGIMEAFYGNNNNAVIHHNIIYDFQNGSRSFTANGSDFRQVYHNTIINTSPPDGLRSDSPDPDAIIQTRYNNNLQISLSDMEALGVDMRGNHNYSSSDFVNFNGKDFRLAAGSDAIDIGVVLPGVNDGYSGAAPDAGALEFGESMWAVGHDFVNKPTPIYAWEALPGTNIYTNSQFNQGIADWTIVSGSPNSADRNSWNLSREGNSLTGFIRTQSVEFTPGEAMSREFTGLTPNTTYTVGAGARIINQVTVGSQFDASSGSVSTGIYRDERFATGLSSGEWVRYDNIDFGDAGQFDLIEVLYTRAALNDSIADVEIQIRLDSPTGQLLGEFVDPKDDPGQNWFRNRGDLPTISGSHSIYISASGSNSVNLAVGPVRLLKETPPASDKLTATAQSSGTPTVSSPIGWTDWQLGYETFAFKTGPSATSATITFSNNGRINAYLDRLFLIEGELRTGINLAYTDGIASQSTTEVSMSASNATDQDPLTQSQTLATDNNSWWQVRFPKDFSIGEIELFNRDNASYTELSNFTVSIWNEDPDNGGSKLWEKSYLSNGSVNRGGSLRITGGEIADGSTLHLATVLGRVVRVQLNGHNNDGNGTLSLADVRVVSSDKANPIANVALSGTATQSSNHYYTHGFADTAINGTVDPAAEFTTTQNSSQPWWQVDLEQTTEIDQIVLYNRQDAADRLGTFRVSVWNGDPTSGGTEVWGKNYSYSSSAPALSTTSIGPGGGLLIDGSVTSGGTRLDEVTDGQFVRVQLTGSNFLSLVEVQVWKAGTVIDANALQYNYDPGTSAAIFPGSQLLAPNVTGDISFTGTVDAVDRGSSSGNAYNRDFVRGTTPAIFNHRIANGRYRVTLNMSDPSVSLDNMYVQGEGVVLATNIDRPIGQNGTMSLEVDVTDGQLNLEFGDADTVNPLWVVNRIVLTRIPNGSPAIDPNGGVVDEGTEATFTNPDDVGTIYYTTDGSDPKLPDGNINPNAAMAGGTVTTIVNLQDFDGVTAPAIPSQWTATTTNSASNWTTNSSASDGGLNGVSVNNTSQTADVRLTSAPFAVEANSRQISFRNSYNVESTYDGGVLEISIDSGTFVDILAAGGSFVEGSYNQTINASYGNPLAGRQAWSGNSNGFIDTVVNLPATAVGSDVQLRWRFGSDNIVAGSAWAIDTIEQTVEEMFPGTVAITEDMTITARTLIGNVWSGTAQASFALTQPATIESRLLFYNNSDFDGNDSAANTADEGAIASDKQALLPGQNASFANYTSYSRGVNGIIIDIANLPASGLSADDFTLRVGNDSDTSTFTDLEIVPGFSRRTGEGANSSDRITLTLPDKAVVGKWLQVTVKANENTALETPDVFYFGNAPGEVGNSTDDTSVSNADVLKIRLNRTAGGTTVDSTSPYDINRDQIVSNADVLLARLGRTTSEAELKLITPSGASNFSSIVGVSALQATDTNADGVVSAMDALLVINHLSGSTNNTSGEETASQEKWSHLDVDGNGHVTALDALMVINEMNRSQTNPNSSVSQSPQAFDLALRDLQSEDEEDDIQLLDSRLDSV